MAPPSGSGSDAAPGQPGAPPEGGGTGPSPTGTGPGSASAPEPGAPGPEWSLPPAPPRPPRNRLPWLLGFVGTVLVGATISAAVVTLPYYGMSPGSVMDSSEAITVEGTPTDELETTVNYTTVSIKPLTTLELLAGWLDGDVDIHHRREILGDRDPDENRDLNLALMGSSQDFATYVALEETGYDVEVDQSGEMVAEVLEDFPADGELEVGDVILEAEGQVLDSPEVLLDMLDGRAPGETVDLVVAPFEELDERRPVTLALAPDPDDESRGIMGVLLSSYDLTFDFPVEVSFHTGDVGGPSAGLAFTLTLVDLLTEGDLTGGLDVAVTGEMGIDGSVGSVGGTGQKAAAARSAGMDLFLVPADGEDYANALPHAGDMEVVEVGTIDEALDVLAEQGGDPPGAPTGDVDGTS